jgi:hypothetical protein
MGADDDQPRTSLGGTVDDARLGAMLRRRLDERLDLQLCGQVSLGVMTDAGLVSDPERIVAAFGPQLGSLAGAAA